MCLACVCHGTQAAIAHMRQDGDALWWASVELKRDREVVIVAVTQHGRALRFASAELI